MKILLVSVGTRGDMEPFLAIGQLLKSRGHEVSCAFPAQFQSLTIESGLNFFPLGAKFIDLIESEDGKAAMGGASGFRKFIGTIKLAFRQKPANQELVRHQFQTIQELNPDRVLYNSKAVYPLLWALDNPGKTLFVSPLPYMHYVKGHTHVAFNGDYGEALNILTFSLAEFGLITTIKTAGKWLNLNKKVKSSEIRRLLRENRTIYTISPSLFSRPYDWEPQLQILGYLSKTQQHNWQPDDRLIEFLDRHSKVMFITFGSMTNADPSGKTQIFLEILSEQGIPAIINVAEGGLVEPANYDRGQFYFVSGIPYHWIFPKVYAVVHHGGSGTTHLGLKYGCATMIIPHIIDQFVWNRIISEKGAGPKGIKINRINNKNLGPRISELWSNPSYKSHAAKIASSMMQEDYTREILEAITE